MISAQSLATISQSRAIARAGSRDGFEVRQKRPRNPAFSQFALCGYPQKHPSKWWLLADTVGWSRAEPASASCPSPYFLRALFFFRGTCAPDRRASESPIAIACLRLLTFLPERPLRRVPRFR